MSRSTTSALRDGVILNNRYRIVKQIGQGGFGRAYLAEDAQRYQELYVLKEFAPQIESQDELLQGEKLFEQEAGILYKLTHQQIPRFETLFRTWHDGRQSLFLVQEYIIGKSYGQLLQQRGQLSQQEVTEMIWDILPVLDYIHSLELVHRDISPDNLILRDRDQKTALIDFGCVKLAANSVLKTLGQTIALIGQRGYTPNEQLHRNLALPSSDLYSLAVTSLVLLTGKQPDKLYDNHQEQWNWHQVSLSPHLQNILQKMLATRPSDRYQSVDELRQVLAQKDNSAVFLGLIAHVRSLLQAPRGYSLALPFKRTPQKFPSVTIGGSPSNDYPDCSTENADPSSTLGKYNFPPTNSPDPNNTRTRLLLGSIPRRIYQKVSSTAQVLMTNNFREVKPWQWGILASAIVIIPGLISFSLMNHRVTQSAAVDFLVDSPNLNDDKQDEQDFRRQIYQEVESLKIDRSAFYKEVDTIFNQQYPELAGKQLTKSKEHEKYREVWYQIANRLLEKQEKKPETKRL